MADDRLSPLLDISPLSPLRHIDIFIIKIFTPGFRQRFVTLPPQASSPGRQPPPAAADTPSAAFAAEAVSRRRCRQLGGRLPSSIAAGRCGARHARRQQSHVCLPALCFR